MVCKAWLAAAFLALVGCGDDDGSGSGDGAYLTIVGEDDLFGDPGTTSALTVRYHDGAGHALAGSISFSFAGDPAGSVLSRTTVVTNQDGMANVELTFSENGDAAFQVVASAEAAAPAHWRISVLPKVLDLDGIFRVDSTFSLPGGLPAGEADGLMTFVDMTNGPNDPATWILDRMQAELDDPLDDVLAVARAGLNFDARVNEWLLDNSPGAVTTIRTAGDRVDELIRTLSLVSRLDLVGQDVESDSMSGSHLLTGAVFALSATRYEYTAEQMALGTMTAGQLSVSRPASGRMSATRHTLHLPYGRILAWGVDHVVVPSIDASASTLTQLVANAVDCEGLGARIAAETDFGSGAIYQAACVIAVDAALGELLGDLRGIEADLNIAGTADLIDGNGDRKVEKLMGGQWEGDLVFPHGTVALPRPNQTFSATRLADSPN